MLSKKILCLLAAGLVFSSSGNSYASDGQTLSNGTTEQQQAKITIQGKIADSRGEPLIGVSVAVKGTTQGTLTDIDGAYTLSNVTSGATITYTYVGFKTETRVVNQNQTINITMQEDSKIMDEVVVVGYGSQKKENLTGAVASVEVDKVLGSRPIADVGRGLQGAVAGLNIVVPSGEVGSDPLMKIRGHVGSIEGNNKPLILLDNVEIPSIQMVNPNDIESISVLKDAASSSIYGAKAAFGVILITTKKGANVESFEVSYSGNVSWQNPAKKIEMAGLDGIEYTLIANENRKTPPPAGGFWRIDRESYERAKEWQQKYGGKVKSTDPVVYNRDWYYDGTNKYGLRIYDPAEIMIEEWTPTQTHNLSAIGRSGKTSYNIGLGYIGQTGMMKTAKHDDFKRYTASLSVSSDINKYLTVRASAMYSDRNKRYATSGATTSDPWLYVYRWSRLFPIGVQENGQNLKDPAYETAFAPTANQQNKYYSVNLGATINFTKDWNLEFDYTYNNQQTTINRAMPMFHAGNTWYTPVLWKDKEGNQVYVDDEGNVTNDGGVAAYMFPQEDYLSNSSSSYVFRSSREDNNNIFNVYSTYNLKLGNEQQHAFKFMAGMNRVSQKWKMNGSQRNDLFDYENPQFEFATGEDIVTSGADWESQLGFFGRVNYAFNSKYLFEANLRYDGSSKFPKDLRWQWFPSFSGGWVISNESFMKPLEPVLSFTKFRASWGSIGDQSVNNRLYYPTLGGYKTNWLSSGGNQFYAFDGPTAVSRDIKWQRIETLDFGVDTRFFRDKLGVSFDWYQRYTRDMIIPGDALPHTYGETAPKANYGNLRTRGWEITVDFNHRFANGIGVNAMATLSDAVTMITKGNDWATDPANRSIGNTWSTGRRYGDIYGYVTDRLYQADDFVYDADGNIQQTWIIINGISKKTNMLAGNNPTYQTYLEDGNQTILFSPGDVKYVDLNGDGYITPGDGTVGDPGDRKVIGNSTPRYEYGFRLGADYKGFDLSVFFQGIGKRDIWGDGNLAIAGYNAKEGAIPQTFVDDYWKPDRTDAYYPRAWDLGGSNTGYSMQVQTRYLLDMSYLRIKNITLGYSIPPKLLRKAYLTKARFYVSLENFFTFDNLRGLPIDPEAVSGYSMFNTSNYNLSRTGMGTPTFKSASIGVQLSF